MKRIKQEPSVAGLLLIVTGMLLLSVLLLNVLGDGTFTGDSSKVTLAIASAAIVTLSSGAALSARQRK